MTGMKKKKKHFSRLQDLWVAAVVLQTLQEALQTKKSEHCYTVKQIIL